MIIFKTIRFKNFLSTGNNFTEISLNSHRNNIIVGTNGAGKSTILDALTFGLFNKPFRKINKPQLVNSINCKECSVEIEFSVSKKEYKVIRGMKPNIFEVYVNGKMLDQDAAIVDQQKFLEQNILKLNYKSFTQIVVLGSSTFIPFMQLPLASRREIIEDLLDIQVFSIMNTNLKERTKRLVDDMRVTENNIDLVKHKIETQENLIKELESKSDSIVLDKSNKIDQFFKQSNFLLEENEDLNIYISEKQSELSGQDKLSSKFDNLKEYKFKFKNKISNLTKENQFYNQNDNCPTCKQILDESFKLEKIAKNYSALKETENAWTELENEMQKVEKQLDNFKKINSDIQNKYSQIDKNNSMINHLQIEINQLEKEINDVQDQKNSSNKEREVLDKLNLQLNSYEEMFITHKQNKDYYNLCSNLLKDT